MNVQEVVELENKGEVIMDKGVEDMIAVWEEMAREDMPIPTPSLQGGGGGRRQSQDFRNLVDIFEYGGGGSDVTQPGLKKIVGQDLNPSFLSETEHLENKGRGAVVKSYLHSKSMISGRGLSGHNRPSLCPAVKRGRESEISGGGKCKRLRGGGGDY